MSDRSIHVAILESFNEQTINDLIKNQKRYLMNQMEFYEYANEFEFEKSAEEMFDEAFLSYDNGYETYHSNTYMFNTMIDAKCGDIFLCIFTRNSAGSWQGLEIFLMTETHSPDMPYYCGGNLSLPS